MGFKDLFLTEEGVTPKQEVVSQPQQPVKQQSVVTNFPTTSVAPPQNVVNTFTQVSPTQNRFLNDIIDVYDKGFNKLNQPGYDFFEFYKAICSAGVDNIGVYAMAFQMAQAMDSSVNKQSLITQSVYYITELEKVHKNFSTDGNSKMLELTNNKSAETNSLTTDINNLKEQIQLLNESLLQKQNVLAQIDTKYSPQMSEISEKLSANDVAKDMIISNITKVKTNIENNL